MNPSQPPSSDPPFDRIEDTTGGMELVRVHDIIGSDEEHGYVLSEIREERSIYNANYSNNNDDDNYFIGFYTDLQLSSPERTKKIKYHHIPQNNSKQHEIDQKRLGIVIIGVGQLDPNWERENDGARL
jgi:hypothetical protein